MIVLLMGLDSYSLMYFFPITLSVIHIFGRRETFIHLIVWLIIYFLNVGLLLFYAHFYQAIELSDDVKQIVIRFNILLAFFCGVAIIAIITWNSITLEESIRKKSKEKEILLAELFHRVKNNLNLVTSLLNIRKNKSNSAEVAEALEDCRNRVFSMALVHDKLYAENQIGLLNLNDFVDELLHSIELNLGEEAEIDVQFSGTIYLSLKKSVPAGLIVNELLTNVYKHAKVEGQQLVVKILIQHFDDEISIVISDNGPGFNLVKSGEKNLGLELVQSLADQLDGEFSLVNNHTQTGALATLTFKV
ncbi:MAG: sensor histidine kinase [Bacteroidota bacterium]